MIYVTKKGIVFAFEDGFAHSLSGKKFIITREQLDSSEIISHLPKDYLFLFKDLDLKKYKEIKESGEADLYIIDRITNNGIETFLERMSICEVDGKESKKDAFETAKKQWEKE